MDIIILLLNLSLTASFRDLLAHHYAVHFGQIGEAIDGGNIFCNSQPGSGRKTSPLDWSRFYFGAFTGALVLLNPTERL